MNIRLALVCLIMLGFCFAKAGDGGFSTPNFTVTLGSGGTLWRYSWPGGRTIGISAPVWELDGRDVKAGVCAFRSGAGVTLPNGETEQTFTGRLLADTSLSLSITFRWAQDNPVVRFRYSLMSTRPCKLTRVVGRDRLEYLSMNMNGLEALEEVRLAAFNERDHAYHLSEIPLRGIAGSDQPVAGPIVVAESSSRDNAFLVAYEHGSTYPDIFVGFKLPSHATLHLQAIKGNYVDGQEVSPGKPFETLWMEVAGTKGDEQVLAAQYRQFVLRYLALDPVSRQPFLYYNTWGRQERTKWLGGRYLSGMNLSTVLGEIEAAHRLGIEVYVLDAGWFLKTGDWNVNTRFFPDTLQRVKMLIDHYQMKLGLWFNPMLAAPSSDMLHRNQPNRLQWQGKADKPFPVWETEASVRLDIVSPFWIDFADALIHIAKSLGVRYFKWDAVGQYGCDAPGHFHGDTCNTLQERADNYAFELPIYLNKIADRVATAVPGVVVDFDITEPGRSMGLSFLASGKYFMMNNGPYYCDYDLAAPGKTLLSNGNVNLFVNPGPARGWITRSILSYDKWIPSVLFLTHYQLDGSRGSQDINLASLMLGQNGIWGDILHLSCSDVAYIHHTLSLYKLVRNDITQASLVRTGQNGEDPEIDEKVFEGRGVVAMFASMPGRYTYCTQEPMDKQCWASDGTKVSYNENGQAVLSRDFDGPGVALVLFGSSH